MTIVRILTFLSLAAKVFAQTNAIQLCDQQSTRHCMTIKAPATLPANVTCTLGTTGFGSCSSGAPAGANTYVQFNDSGAFGADINFNWDKVNHRLAIGWGSAKESLMVNGNISMQGTLMSNMYFDLGTLTYKAAASGYGAFLQPADIVNGGLTFYNTNSVTTGANYTLTERLRIDNSGNIGISEHSPGAKLHINGPDIGPGVGLGTLIVAGGDNIHQTRLGYNKSSNYGWVQSSDSSVFTSLALNGAGGNVGVGTTAPAYKLDVSGDFHVSSTSTLSGSVDAAGLVTVNSGNSGSVQMGSSSWVPGTTNVVTLGSASFEFASGYFHGFNVGAGGLGTVGFAASGSALFASSVGVLSSGSLSLGFITGSTQCLQVNSSGVVSGAATTCGGSSLLSSNNTWTGFNIFSHASGLQVNNSISVNAGGSGNVTLGSSEWGPVTTNTVALGDASHEFAASYFHTLNVSTSLGTVGFAASGSSIFGSSVAILGSGSLTLGFVGGSTQCLQANSSGVVSGTGSGCGASSLLGSNNTWTGANVFNLGIQANSGVVSNGNDTTAGQIIVNNGNGGKVSLGSSEWAPLNTDTVALGDLSHRFASSYFAGLSVSNGSTTTSIGVGTLTVPSLSLLSGSVVFGAFGSAVGVSFSSIATITPPSGATPLNGTYTCGGGTHIYTITVSQGFMTNYNCN